jgi:hypothetical protein
MDQDREITREELHQLVWSKPTRVAAKEFGLSDDKVEAARENLVRHGVEVSEVFHGAADVYSGPDEPYLFGRIRVNGPDPEHRSYRSFASFRDPDGNGWLFQEITMRLPVASTTRRRPLHRRTIWRARFGVRRPPTACTRSTSSSATPTGQTGMPLIWWRSGQAKSCRNEQLGPLG